MKAARKRWPAGRIFDAINISLPPVVRLSKRYGFSKVCYNVAEFAREAARMLAEKEA